MNETEGKIPDSVQQKTKKIRQDVLDLLRELQKELGVSVTLESVIKQVLPSVIDGSMQTLGSIAATLLQDPDRQERLRIHTLIGNVLAEELKITSEQGKIVSYHLMNETQINDLAVNGQLPAPPSELLQAAARILLSVKLRYEQRNMASSDPLRQKGKSSIVSVIEIYLLRPNTKQLGPMRKELTSELDFENMLSGARETWIREGNRQPVIYKLFPRRTE